MGAREVGRILPERMTGDARHQGPDRADTVHVYPFTGDPRL